MAATMHKTEICKFLMEKGADATLKDDKGRTALMNCAGISDNTDPDVSKFDANQKACYEYLQSVTPAEAKAPEAAAEPPAVAGDPEPAKSVVAGDPAPASVVAGDPCASSCWFDGCRGPGTSRRCRRPKTDCSYTTDAACLRGFT